MDEPKTAVADKPEVKVEAKAGIPKAEPAKTLDKPEPAKHEAAKAPEAAAAAKPPVSVARATAPAPSRRPPMMDVKPPQRPAAEIAAPPDVVAPAPEEAKTAEAKPAKAVPPQVHRPPKAPHPPGYMAAIVGTVIIVLGLGILATYAYLKSQNTAILL